MRKNYIVKNYLKYSAKNTHPKRQKTTLFEKNIDFFPKSFIVPKNSKKTL